MKRSTISFHSVSFGIWPLKIKTSLAKPKNHGNGFCFSISAWDNNINEIKRRVCVAESNGGNVNIWSFNDGLSIWFRVSNNQDSGLLELFGDLIGKSTWNPSCWCAGSASSVLTEFVDGSLPEILGTDNDDIAEVRNRSNDSGSQFNFLQDFIDFEDIVANTVFTLHVFLHVVINLSSSEMGLYHFLSTLAERSLRMSFCSL